MSYNLLLDTNIINNNNQISEHWKLTNCYYRDGYLVSNDTFYSIEQEISLPNLTKLYFSMDYIAFDKNIKKVYIGIQCGDTLESTIKKIKFNNRHRISVIHNVDTEKIKVRFIVEAKTKDTKLYIDSPLLVDLHRMGKDSWPKWMLNRYLDYRQGYNYKNLYKECEITLQNEDFKSAFSTTQEANIGILSTLKRSEDWYGLNFESISDRYYLIKLDICQVNQYGEIYMQYGEILSEQIDDEQLYIIFKADNVNQLKIKMKNNESLQYVVNLKRVLIVDITDRGFEDRDIIHLPFID